MTQPLHTISSKASIQVFGTTGAASASPSSGGWSSLSSKKTASFSTIQQEVVQTVTYSPTNTYKAYNPAEDNLTLYTEQPNGPRLNGARPDLPGGSGDNDTPPPTGELLPIGDMLIPMLLIALGYVVVKFFRNRKTSRAL